MTTAIFYVVTPSPDNNNTSNLISLQTAQELGLVSLHIKKITTGDTAFDNTVNKHETVFKGLGCLKADPIKLSINKQHPPKAQPMRRIPYHMRKKVEDALQNLEQERIIYPCIPENESTPWVSPIVVVPKKDGRVRICVDMRLANEAIERVRHPIPTVDDVRFALNGHSSLPNSVCNKHIINCHFMKAVDILQHLTPMLDYFVTNDLLMA